MLSDNAGSLIGFEMLGVCTAPCHTMLQSKNTSDLISFLLLQEATALRHVGGLDALGGNQKGVKSEFLALTQILC